MTPTRDLAGLKVYCYLTNGKKRGIWKLRKELDVSKRRVAWRDGK